MRSIDKYLAKAIEVIEAKKSGFWSKSKTEIPKVYKGYIASFGTIIKQSGLLPAVVLFSVKAESGDASKKPIAEAIFALLKEKTNLVDSRHKTLLDFARDNQHSAQARKETIYAAIALKLALRTFNIEK